MEELVTQPQKPLHTTEYVFTMDKAQAFLHAINQLPTEEVGYYTVYNLTRLKTTIYESPNGNLEERELLFALSTDFKEEHEYLRTMAEQESIFYAKTSETTLFGEFLNFLPEQYSQDLLDYLASINKPVLSNQE